MVELQWPLIRDPHYHRSRALTYIPPYPAVRSDVIGAVFPPLNSPVVLVFQFTRMAGVIYTHAVAVPGRCMDCIVVFSNISGVYTGWPLVLLGQTGALTVVLSVTVSLSSRGRMVGGDVGRVVILPPAPG